MSIKSPPTPLFLTDNIKMDRIPTKIIWKIHAPFYFVFQVLKVHLSKICKIDPPDLLILVFISFYISRYYFSQLFRTSLIIICKKRFSSQIVCLTDSPKRLTPLMMMNCFCRMAGWQKVAYFHPGPFARHSHHCSKCLTHHK